MGRRSFLRLLAAAIAVGASALLPATAAAHPLGNFTINHYVGLTLATDHVVLDVVIDMAEIPAFQERQTMDTDGDGVVSDEEVATRAAGACRAVVGDIHLERDGVRVPIVAGSSSGEFLPGAGGLSTLRLTCGLSAVLAPVVTSPATLTYQDDSYPGRLGWREIVATGNGTIIDAHGLPTISPSQRLTAYPKDMIALPLDVKSATIDVRPDPAAAGVNAIAAPPAAGTAGSAGGNVGAVPGGVAGELPDIFLTRDLTPLVVLAALATAAFIGALHAVTPGHGKTLMAAYLVGTRGTSIHAVGLGLSVAVSHTLGILALALVIVGAGSVLPPDVVYRVTPVIAGISIVVIGGWMLVGEVRRRRRSAARAAAAAAAAVPDRHAHAAGIECEQDHPHEHEHDAAAHDHPHEHEHERGRVDEEIPGEHSHGGVHHSHLPQAGSTLTWRGLFFLGLAGGLIPSTSALIILLGSIAAGRPAFGLVLVVAFGIGMAAVMTGVGLAMIFARTRLDRMPSRSSLGRLATAAPLVASVAVLGLGLILTWQAVAGAPVL